jgi:hypothetical protein
LHTIELAKVAIMVSTSVHLIGLVQPHPMTGGRLVFLVLLVAFFSVLFVVTYVWMRRPDFGQHGNEKHVVKHSKSKD